jgi:hypothetical protein
MASSGGRKVEMRNVLSPGHVVNVSADKYEATKRAFLKVLPGKAPGLTASEIRERVLPLLPDALFPGGATAGWWIKGVQLDLEAREVVVREKTRPLRWRKAQSTASGDRDRKTGA